MSDEEVSVDELRLYACRWILNLLEGRLPDEDLLFVRDLLQYVYSSDTQESTREGVKPLLFTYAKTVQKQGVFSDKDYVGKTTYSYCK